MCVFSPHNVLRDPSFSRLDLISCRNLFIYFGAEFQARVLPLFHFALKPSGILFLGTSENVSQHPDLFAALDKKNRIYRRRDGAVIPLKLPRGAASTATTIVSLAQGKPGASLSGLRNAVEARVMEHFSPAHVLVNREGDILFYSARTGKYLEAAAGLPSRQLLVLARRGLRLGLGSALREALETGKRTERDNLAFDVDGHSQAVDLVVEPFAQNDHDPLFLVIFRDVAEPAASDVEADTSADRKDNALHHVERELNETRERLQLMVEEYETAVEELKSSNEELQSINEELQSTNEEMETSKEEFQSVIEELNTVNAELGDKVEELDRAYDDLRNVFEATGVAIVFLDRKFVIRNFTPAATAIFKLIPSDRGRPLTDIVSTLVGTEDLKRDIKAVFSTGMPIERRVSKTDGHTHYVMRVIPYQNDERKMEGALIVFFDVSSLIEHEGCQRELLEELNTRVGAVLNAVVQISEQAPTEDWSATQFREAFLGRLHSIAACYNLLAQIRWSEASLADIIACDLDPYRRRNSNRIVLSGPMVRLPAAKALALGMVLHEMAANAARHGALSTAKGHLSVHWEVRRKRQGSSLEMEWQETRGPRVVRPRRKGFGRMIIDRETKVALRGRITIVYVPTGLRAHLSIPLAKDRESDN